ncbi:flagellar hook protein FlgE [Marinobacter sediminum]|uniref:flagellar hook protein FlgE n=1 Tax=Marinobacter sediminum TaxID=256323 RepID=UPI00193A1E41|nr:flagellar hook protein FlgE [Marinobacter sediminum]
MAFNTGLSGLRAASVDLDVTGNNIANASTVGFKGSKAQFGDLYASGFLGAGNSPVGDGVRVQDVKQSFSQGNVSFTDSGLDMAISGDGFFILNNGGETRYSRAGQFGIDKDGFVTNNQGMRVQGFTADDNGNLSGIRGDLQIDSDNLAPRRTTNLVSDLNLDSREPVLEVRGTNVQTGQPDPDNQYAAETVRFTQADGSTNVVNIPANSSAADVAGLLGSVENVSASARTTFTFSPAIVDGRAYTVQGESFTASASSTQTPLQSLIDQINNSSLDSVFASDVGGELQLIESQGRDILFQDGSSPAVSQTGALSITLGRDIDPPVDDGSGGTPLFLSTSGTDVSPFVTNEFDPQDQRTYNHATSTTVYDSLGNSHELTQFFVKDPAPGNGVGQSQWSIYVEIDGEMVPDISSGQQPFTATFNQNGSLESVNGDPSGEIFVTGWTPKDPNGDANGADGPPGAGVTEITEPPSSSAFVINLGGTTQFGASFGVNDQKQDGYTTGRLSGLDVSDTGVIFARYTNGQSQSLGQVALASFNNTNGLSPVGDTSWVETFESGQPIFGAPDTGTLGSIQASSVEESNVDLSAELVNLIIAQRNYQANAKTIETSDAVTQTIINLR